MLNVDGIVIQSVCTYLVFTLFYKKDQRDENKITLHHFNRSYTLYSSLLCHLKLYPCFTSF